jgi:HAD superfamily hydrolase (TIGR01509 family)
MYLFFDLDGVLIDLKELHRDAYITAWNHIHPQSPIDIGFHSAHLEARPTKDKTVLCDKILHTSTIIQDICTLKQTLTEQLLENFQALPSVTETIRWLKAQGHKLACCSNSVRKTILLALQKLNILDQFDLILSNQDVSKSKPDPEIYQTAAAYFSVESSECLVFEDSVVGKRAAMDAGCTVIPILTASDLTIDFIKICIEQRSRIPASCTSTIHLVIPMGGLGSRFEKEGYTTPKPFLPIFGKEMYKWVIENMLPRNPTLRSKIQTHIIIRKEHETLFENTEFHLHTVPALTEGPACTVLTIKDILNTSNPLIIANSDQHLEWNSDALYYSLLHPNIDGMISTFTQRDPSDIKWSYAKTDIHQNVIEVAEKKYISSNASTGIYGWSKGSDFVQFAESMIQQNIRVNNEFYVCPVYNEAIKIGSKIRVLECEKMWGLGVPKDYELFIASWNLKQEESE